MGEVVPLHELAARAKEKKRPKRLIALSFDDGYCDNFETAGPLLEKYQVPDTFFVTSCKLDCAQEFWWDELENLILSTAKLPITFSMEIAGKKITKDLCHENELSESLKFQHRYWKASVVPPPTKRTELFLTLWSILKGLKDKEIQKILQQVRDWSGSVSPPRLAFKSMTAAQITSLASHHLFTIGAHTMTHPALGLHDFDYQKKEMACNKSILSEITGNTISLLAYPYGHYNETTLRAIASLSFDAAFTTEHSTLTRGTHPHRIGRFQVDNLNGAAFVRSLKH